MKNIWRFFDMAHCISGIVFADSETAAFDYAKQYLVWHFQDITNTEEIDLCVWKIEDDDDYNEDFPYAVAISY